MKKILLIAIASAFVLSSCIDETSKGVSFVTTYPVIEITGDQALTIPLNGTYTDAGCVAMEGVTNITANVETVGTVNPAKTGVYTITYTVSNKDGYSLSRSRYIGVISSAASAMDISGVYKRNAGAGGLATVAKTKFPGLYTNNNPGGIDLETGSPINIFMFQTEATVVSAPVQDSEGGTFACVNGVYDAVNSQYSWKCINSGYGPSTRTFIKQ